MSLKPLILALNRNKRNLEILEKILSKKGYLVVSVLNPQELDSEIEKQEKIDLVLMDISGFDKNIWTSCERLRIKEIPFLILSPHHQRAFEEQGKIQGAHSVLVKPLVVKELLVLIKSLIDD